jgi:hypothetical protein
MVWMAATLAAAAAVIACSTTTVLPIEVAGEGGAPKGAAATDQDDARADDEREAGREGIDGDLPGDAGADASLVDCGVPGQFFTSAQGPFCPFQSGDVFSNCAVGEHCCEYAEAANIPSTCSAGATACAVEIATGFDWRCDETNDCPGGQVCCFASPVTPHPQCIGQYSGSPDAHSTACRIGACAAGETRTCGSQADCPLGTTCTGMRFRGKHFGFCKP